MLNSQIFILVNGIFTVPSRCDNQKTVFSVGKRFKLNQNITLQLKITIRIGDLENCDTPTTYVLFLNDRTLLINVRLALTWTCGC